MEVRFRANLYSTTCGVLRRGDFGGGSQEQQRNNSATPSLNTSLPKVNALAVQEYEARLRSRQSYFEIEALSFPLNKQSRQASNSTSPMNYLYCAAAIALIALFQINSLAQTRARDYVVQARAVVRRVNSITLHWAAQRCRPVHKSPLSTIRGLMGFNVLMPRYAEIPALPGSKRLKE